MVDMVHLDIGGEPTLRTAHQAYREFHSNQDAAAQSGRFASDGGGQKRPDSISLRSAKWLRAPVPRRNLDELRLPALRTRQLALSWQASA